MATGNERDFGTEEITLGEQAEVEIALGERVGEYEILERIGAGGCGSVFKAVHPLIGKVVAIKVLHPYFSSHEQMVSRFVEEARAVNQIQHPNIIDIFNFGNLHNKLHYYVMEYLEGESLRTMTKRRRRLDVAPVLKILGPIVHALDAAHQNGIVHRDLKSDNIFLSRARSGFIEPKLLDFGIAKLLNDNADRGHSTREGVTIGTPAYMSPEQCLGNNVDHRTDIYAFGVLVYRMLTGAMPFRYPSHLKILFAHVHEQPPPLRSVLPTIPEPVEASVLSMLAKSPECRPESILAALDSLQKAAQSAGIDVPCDSPDISAPNWSGEWRLSTTDIDGSMASIEIFTGDAAPGALGLADAESECAESAGTGPTRSVRLPSWQAGGWMASASLADVAESSGVSQISGSAPWVASVGKPRPATANVNESDDGSLAGLASESVHLSNHSGNRFERTDIRGASSRQPLIVMSLVLAVVIGTGWAWYRSEQASSVAATAKLDAIAFGTGSAQRETEGAQADDKHTLATDAASAADGGRGDLANETALDASVAIAITGVPEATAVHGPDGFLGEVPGTIMVPHGNTAIALELAAKGYFSHTEMVVPSKSRALDIALKRKPRRRARPRRNSTGKIEKSSDKANLRDALENPF